MMQNTNILIIDDEIDICEQLSGFLNDIGYETKYCLTSESGIKTFKQNTFSLVILDIWLNNSKFDGFQALENIKHINENIPVIMISGHGNIETAVNSIKKGAYDFIEKPLDTDILLFKITKALENYRLKNKINSLEYKKNLDSNYISNSKSSKEVLSSLKKITNTDSPIILTGDNGNGKEFLAKKIHFDSKKKNKLFSTIDLNKISEESLLEDIFGIDKEKIKKVGILEDVKDGTIFIKNLEKMSSKMQGKFLRIFEEKKFYRIGGFSPIKLNFRFMASCIHSLQQLKQNKKINNDFLNKINFYEIQVPNIKQRSEDVKELVKEFVSESCKIYKVNEKKITNDVIEYYSNLNGINSIAQLKKFIEWTLFMLTDLFNSEINKKSIIELISGFLEKQALSEKNNLYEENIKIARENFEKKYLAYNLNKFRNNINKMSEKIGMERTALYRKIKSMKINMDS